MSKASNIVYLNAVGQRDLSGDDWGDIFAAALNGIPLKSPIGIVDITLANTAWSAKTVSARRPISTNQVRLISGRNNVLYSFNNDDVFADLQKTGDQVLQIWNARVEEATQQYPQLRTIVLIRYMPSFQFKVFEIPTSQFDPGDYNWTRNTGGNLEGRTVNGKVHTFTWQPNGSQFTVIRPVAGSARSFTIKKPETQDPEQLLKNLGYSDDWVTLL